MNRKGKIVTILLILLAAASIFVAGIIYFTLEKEKGQSTALLKKISILEAEKANFEKTLERYKSELAEAGIKLEQSEKKIKELNLSLDVEKNKSEQAVISLNKELEDAKNAKADLEKKISQNQDEINSLKAQLEEIKKEKDTLEKKTKETSLKTDVQLGKIIVGAEGADAKGDTSGLNAAATAKPSEGKVLVVNKEYAFVVINLGLRDGISVGDTLSVYQKDKYIGDVLVERVDEAMSSANFTDASLKDIIKENDRVAIKSR
ncbi:MAG: hypothetical protein Q8L26_04645 [Candidatus Omnitrophota bacterium]|nr:hypothetical protein [Candidatus Omnitrophota bacterium]